MDKQPLSLTDALALYQHEYMASRNLAERTRMEYTNDLRDLIRYLTDHSHVSMAGEVQRRHLECYLAELDRRGFKGSTRRRKVAAIRSFFSFLQKQEVIPLSPAAE